MPEQRGRVVRAKGRPKPPGPPAEKPGGSGQSPESPEELFVKTGKTPTTAWEYQHPDDHAEEEEKAS